MDYPHFVDYGEEKINIKIYTTTWL